MEQHLGCWKKEGQQEQPGLRGRGGAHSKQDSGKASLCGQRLSVGGSGEWDCKIMGCRWSVGQGTALVDKGGFSDSGG